LAQRGVLKKQVTAVGKGVAELNNQSGEHAKHDASLDSARLLGPHNRALVFVSSRPEGAGPIRPRLGHVTFLGC
jgi:hypothetical protein